MEMTNLIVQFLMNFQKIELDVIIISFFKGIRLRFYLKNLIIKQKFNNDKITIKHTFVILNVC